jgi:pyrimidine operon attenuation protein/uracil phosphoribosyltransferase
MPQVMDASRIERTLARIAHEILERNRDLSDVALVGIRTRGVVIAERIATVLQQAGAVTMPVGSLDITLYRDDYMRHPVGPQPVVRSTDIRFSVEGRRILLVDDVLYTGRTIRAALNEIFDYGRPASVRLAALVDRDGRQLPIAAQFAGATLALEPGRSIGLKRDANGRLQLEMREEPR